MTEFAKGDRVRIDIPDETDLDHDAYHGVHGTIVDMLEDDVDRVTGSEKEDMIFRVDLDNGEITDFRSHDLRPPLK